MVVVGVLAAPADASIIYMEFDDGATTIEAGPSDAITVHIFLDVFEAGVFPAEEVGWFQAMGSLNTTRTGTHFHVKNFLVDTTGHSYISGLLFSSLWDPPFGGSLSTE